MWIDIVWILVGLCLILVGANWLTDGASAIASRMGVSDLVIGLTVVALGTSAPELFVSLVAAFSGSAPMAIGNVVGSNIFNILVIIGVTAMVRPIVVERSVMATEIPIVILTSVAMLVLGNSALLDNVPENVITRVDGLFLLMAFVLFMRHTFVQARLTPPDQTEAEPVVADKMPVWKSVLWVVLGLGGLIVGGDRFVSGASGIASLLGVSDAVIGLTIVSMGTSMPELAASVVAAAKGKPGLAVGNVIGSSIFNVLFILGTTATIVPLQFGDINNVDLLTMLLASILFLLFGWLIKVRTITRSEGAVMVAVYVAYLVYLVISV